MGLDAQKEYLHQYIAFEDAVAPGAASSPSARHWSTPYEGKLRKPLEGADFYRKLGRQDLVQGYQTRKAMKAVMEIFGGGALVVGLVYSVVNFASKDSCSHGDCYDHPGTDHTNQGAVGLGIALVGAILLTGGILIKSEPVDPSQARQLANEYNQKLKQRLGISENQTSAPRASEFRMAVAPYVTHSGGGLTLGISF